MNYVMRNNRLCVVARNGVVFSFNRHEVAVIFAQYYSLEDNNLQHPMEI